MDNVEKYQQWLAWVNNRLQTLNEIDVKLQQMRELAIMVQEGSPSQQELENVNQKFKLMEQEVNLLDEESKNYITH